MRGITMPRIGSGPIVAALLSIILVFGFARPQQAEGATPRHRLMRLINRSRHRHDVPRLKINRGLSHSASQHSRQMADARRLFHSADIPKILSGWRWSVWGENVGCAASVARLHRKFMRSSGHRRNILNRSFRRVGIGVVRAPGGTACGGGSRLWVTQIFYG